MRCQSTLVHETNFSANSQTSAGNLSKQNHPQPIIPKKNKKGKIFRWHYNVQKKPPIYRQPFTIYPCFLLFFWILQFFLSHRPNEIWDKQRNKSIKESYFFMFRRLQNITCFFVKTYLCKQHPAQIWLEIITVFGIKKSWKENKHKWKTCQLNNIIAAKSIYY